MKALVALPVVALVVACAATPTVYREDQPATVAARRAYTQCVQQQAATMVRSSEPARDIGTTATGLCSAQLDAVQDAFEADNAHGIRRREYGDAFAQKVRDQARDEVAAMVTRSRQR